MAKTTNHVWEYCWGGDNIEWDDSHHRWRCSECRFERIPYQYQGTGITPINSLIDERYNQDHLSPRLVPEGTSAIKDVKPVRLCRHNRQPFQFDGHTVYLSGSIDRNTKPKAPAATSAIYLADAWIKGRMLTNITMKKPEKDPEMVYVDWQDLGVIEVGVFHTIAEWGISQLEGGHTLEIGCVGGHGRTGTMVCGLMVVAGWHPNAATDEVRSIYCSKAIETKRQENLVKEVKKWRRTTY